MSTSVSHRDNLQQNDISRRKYEKNMRTCLLMLGQTDAVIFQHVICILISFYKKESENQPA